MTAHNGRGQGGDLPYEGVVLPANGESWAPEQQREVERGGAPQPAAGQPWGQPWGPDAPWPPTAAPPPSSLPPPPPEPPAMPPAAPPAEGGLPSLPPAARGGEQWAPPPPSAPPSTPPATPPPSQASAAPATLPVPETAGPSAGPPVPYEPPASAPQPGPYGHGLPHGYAHGHDGAEATQLLPPQQAVPQQPGAGPLPPAADADATQLLPPQRSEAPGPPRRIGDPWPSPQPGAADAGATQMLPPQQDGPGGACRPPQPGPSDAQATQMLPLQPGAGDADATQMLPPQPGLDGALPPEVVYAEQGTARQADAGPPRAGAGYGIRPGSPGERQPPSEFDSLFRSDAPAAGGPPAAGGMGHRGVDFGDLDTAPGTSPQGRAARRRAVREQQGRLGGASPAMLATIGVVVVLVIGLGVGALTGGDEEKPEADGVPTAPVAGDLPSVSTEPTDTAEEQAKQLNKLLEKSNNSRSKVIRAVQNIKACQQLDKAASDLRAAAKQRNGLVTRLSEMETGALPHSAELDSALIEAWKASAEADSAYAAWADQVAGKNGCKKGKARSTHRTAVGNRASGEATAAKKKAAGLWKPTAQKYGLQERQYSQL